MADFMTKQGINPEFSEVSGLITQTGGYRVPETMERNGSRKTYGRFEFGEIPAKICAAWPAYGCFQLREQEFLAVFPEIQNTPVQQRTMDGHVTGARFRLGSPLVFGVRADKETGDTVNLLNILIAQVADFSQPHTAIGGNQCDACKGGLRDGATGPC